MIIFEQTQVAPRGRAKSTELSSAKSPPKALRSGIVAAYGDDSNGYLVRLNRETNFYRLIRIEEGSDLWRGEFYATKIEALEAIFLDRQRFGQLSLSESSSNAWVGSLLDDIKRESAIDENSPQGRATARFSRRMVASYGDDDYGYIIVRNSLGKYRSICFDGDSRTKSKSFPTVLGAMEEAYNRSMGRGRDDLGKSWYAQLCVDLVARGCTFTGVRYFVAGVKTVAGRGD